MTFDDHLQHLVRMASAPGWKEHSWHRAKQLESSYPGISDALVKEMAVRSELQRLRSLQGPSQGGG